MEKNYSPDCITSTWRLEKFAHRDSHHGHEQFKLELNCIAFHPLTWQTDKADQVAARLCADDEQHDSHNGRVGVDQPRELRRCNAPAEQEDYQQGDRLRRHRPVLLHKKPSEKYSGRTIWNNFLGKVCALRPQWENMKFNLKSSKRRTQKTSKSSPTTQPNNFPIFISHFRCAILVVDVAVVIHRVIFRCRYFPSFFERLSWHFEIDWRYGCLLLLLIRTVCGVW